MVNDEEDALPNNDNICNEINYGEQDVLTVTCDYKDREPPLRGRYVTIRRKYNSFDRHLMNFCEIEVLSCPPGRWGYNLNNAQDCSQTCSGCNNTVEPCRVSDGYCYGVCKDGFWGGSCYKQCNCVDDEPCRVSDGYCYSGCKDGFWGGSCDKQCDCQDGITCNQTVSSHLTVSAKQ